ncbi:MAG: CPBP family intramembrane metalloprotease [Bacteroidetes bacterium]|nr:CPBP family intramembrane metalloprotease [Bacteroidota bacterium]
MNYKNIIVRHPITSYFIGTFAISWLGAFILVSSKLFSGQAIPKMDGILMFPLMLIGPVAASLALTQLAEKKTGIRNLFSQMGEWKAPFKWYAIVFVIPPCLILITLFILRTFVSPVFKPNFFIFGFLFGIPEGFLEEIGWTGFAYKKLRLHHTVLKSSVIVGLFWGLWHLPVIDFLGATYPHKQYLLPFFISFTAILVAMRLLMMWVYSKTGSMPLVQFMHVVSTGCLVAFGPFNINPAQEALWYAMYAIVLFISALFVFKFSKTVISWPNIS